MIATNRQQAASLASRWVAETLVCLIGTHELVCRLAKEANTLLLCGFAENELMLTGSDQSIAADGESVLGLDWHVHPAMFDGN